MACGRTPVTFACPASVPAAGISSAVLFGGTAPPHWLWPRWCLESKVPLPLPSRVTTPPCQPIRCPALSSERSSAPAPPRLALLLRPRERADPSPLGVPSGQEGGLEQGREGLPENSSRGLPLDQNVKALFCRST